MNIGRKKHHKTVPPFSDAYQNIINATNANDIVTDPDDIPPTPDIDPVIKGLLGIAFLSVLLERGKMFGPGNDQTLREAEENRLHKLFIEWCDEVDYISTDDEECERAFRAGYAKGYSEAY